MENQESSPPPHLAEQVLYTFNRAIDATMELFGDRAHECGVQLRKGYGSSFENEFNELRAGITSLMKNQSNYSFDAHKLAAIAMLAVLTSRPLIVSANNEGHSVNEVVAFFLAVYIIRDYQAIRACDGDSTKCEKVKAQIHELVVPKLIYGHQEPREAIIIALRFLSRRVRVSTPQNADIVPILSILEFYIDNYSYESIYSISLAI